MESTEYTVLVARGNCRPGDRLTEREVRLALLYGDIEPGVVLDSDKRVPFIVYNDRTHGPLLLEAVAIVPEEGERLAGHPGQTVYIGADTAKKYAPGTRGLLLV